MSHTNNENGQSLFEVLAAIGVIAVALVAFIGLSARSVSDSSFVRNKSQASRYTQQAYEWVRGERDANWTIFFQRSNAAAASPYCINTLDWTVPGTCATGDTIVNTIFKREIVLTRVGAVDEVEVDIVTSWEDSKGVHSSRSTTILSDWRSK